MRKPPYFKPGLLSIIISLGTATGCNPYLHPWGALHLDPEHYEENLALYELIAKDEAVLRKWKSHTGTSALFKESFGISFSGDEIAQWIINRVSDPIQFSPHLISFPVVEYSPEGGVTTRLRGEAAMNLSAFGPESWGKIRVGRVFLDPKKSRIFRLSTLIHEARHSDGFPHTYCPEDFSDAVLRDRPACDTHLNGSYGLEAVFLREVATRCSTCSPLTRQQARESLMKITKRILNQDLQTSLLEDFTPAQIAVNR